MNAYESLSHTRWEYKYHIVFIQQFAFLPGSSGIPAGDLMNTGQKCPFFKIRK